MSDSFKKFQETFEIFANQQAAEIEAVRAVLQGFVVSILSAHPKRAELFSSLRASVLDGLDSATNEAAHVKMRSAKPNSFTLGRR